MTLFDVLLDQVSTLINPRDLYTKQLTIMDSVLGSFIVASEGE